MLTALGEHASDDYAPRAYLRLGELLQAQERLDEASAAFEAAGAKLGRCYAPDVAINLAARSAALGRTDEAVEGYQILIFVTGPDEPIAALAAYRLAHLYEEAGNHEGALQLLRDAVAHSDESLLPHAAFELAQMLVDRGDTTEAKELLQRVVASDHADMAPAAVLAQGDLARANGEFDEAQRLYELCIESAHPDHAPEGSRRRAQLRESRIKTVFSGDQRAVEVFLSVPSVRDHGQPGQVVQLAAIIEEELESAGAMAGLPIFLRAPMLRERPPEELAEVVPAALGRSALHIVLDDHAASFGAGRELALSLARKCPVIWFVPSGRGSANSVVMDHMDIVSFDGEASLREAVERSVFAKLPAMRRFVHESDRAPARVLALQDDVMRWTWALLSDDQCPICRDDLGMDWMQARLVVPDLPGVGETRWSNIDAVRSVAGTDRGRLAGVPFVVKRDLERGDCRQVFALWRDFDHGDDAQALAVLWKRACETSLRGWPDGRMACSSIPTPNVACERMAETIAHRLSSLREASIDGKEPRELVELWMRVMLVLLSLVTRT